MSNTDFYTTVYFVGGPWAGRDHQLKEPLPSVYDVAPAPTQEVRFTNDPAPFDGTLTVHRYILHTIKRGKHSAPRRVYISAELQFGGITEKDLRHVP